MTPDPPAASGYVPVVRPRIGAAPERPEPRLLDALRAVSMTEVSDVVGRLYTMDPGIRPLYLPVARTVGVCRTVKAFPGDNLAVHGGLGRVGPDDVLVVDWLGYQDGCGSGARALEAPITRGLAGVVVDGGWRDVAALQARGFPVFGRRETAYSPPKREPGELDVPVCCGGVVVEPGDVVVADEGGVAVVPRRHLIDVVAALATRAAAEQAMLSGVQQQHASAFDDRLGLRD